MHTICENHTMSDIIHSNRYTQNEMSNMIYLGFKYICGLVNPDNKDIEIVMIECGNDPDLDKICRTTVEFARSKLGILHVDYYTTRRIEDMKRYLEDNFFTAPEHIRNSLGEDEQYFVCRTLH